MDPGKLVRQVGTEQRAVLAFCRLRTDSEHREAGRRCICDCTGWEQCF